MWGEAVYTCSLLHGTSEELIPVASVSEYLFRVATHSRNVPWSTIPVVRGWQLLELLS